MAGLNKIAPWALAGGLAALVYAAQRTPTAAAAPANVPTGGGAPKNVDVARQNVEMLLSQAILQPGSVDSAALFSAAATLDAAGMNQEAAQVRQVATALQARQPTGAVLMPNPIPAPPVQPLPTNPPATSVPAPKTPAAVSPATATQTFVPFHVLESANRTLQSPTATTSSLLAASLFLLQTYPAAKYTADATPNFANRLIHERKATAPQLRSLEAAVKASKIATADKVANDLELAAQVAPGAMAAPTP